MMDITGFNQFFRDNFPIEILKFNEPLCKHTSFRIGGPASVMVFPRTVEELAAVLQKSALLDKKTVILGAGTNVLAPDEGMDTVIICLKDALTGKELLSDNRIRVMAGETMTKAAIFAANHGLSGLEFAHGIPGTVGGGVYMNAGAYGGEICQVCQSVEVLSQTGEKRVMSAAEMAFSYRHSTLEDSGDIVVAATFILVPEDPEQIRGSMKDLMNRRAASQPLDLPSAGSAFKRPAGGYAAALIEQAGLKGYCVGGAGISNKHAGFAVNLGNATAKDVRDLLMQVSDIVFEKSGIRLEPEVRIW